MVENGVPFCRDKTGDPLRAGGGGGKATRFISTRESAGAPSPGPLFLQCRQPGGRIVKGGNCVLYFGGEYDIIEFPKGYSQARKPLIQGMKATCFSIPGPLGKDESR